MAVRPRVVTGNIATLDGRIAASASVPSWQDEQWAPILQAGYELIDFAKLHGAAVTLEGSNSFVAREANPVNGGEEFSPDGLHKDYLPKGVMQRFDRWMVVVDSRGRIAWTQTEGGGIHVAVLVSMSTPSNYLAFLREREVPYLVCGENRVDLEVALGRISQTFDTDLVVSTAGGVLNGALLRAGFVDEVNLQVLPIVLGCGDVPAIFEGYNPGLTTAPCPLTLLEAQTRTDGSVLMRFAPDREKGI